MREAKTHAMRRGALGAAIAVAMLLGGCDESHSPCNAGETQCSRLCVDLATSTSSCGACRNACPALAQCQDGACVCPAAQPDVCDGACVNLQSDSAHCGTCAQACGFGSCVGGACVCATSPATVTNCGGSPACVDTARDRQHCGGCTTACPLDSAVCAESACVCPASQPTECPVDHPSACVSLQTDTRHCGSCENPCKATEECALGVCGCPAALPDICSGACVALETDTYNCGACGTVCTANRVCTARQCLCGAALPDECGGACVSLAADPEHCGTCTTRCPLNATCSERACVCAHAAPLCQGSCCAGGAACCADGTCPLAHDNGLGASYYDCAQLGTYTVTAATEAAFAWDPAGALGPTTFAECVVWQGATRCAVWCFGGFAQGLVHLNSTGTGCPAPTLINEPGTYRWD